MAKHELITENLKALTGTRTFETAIKGWSVLRLVSLNRGPGQSCELCGTRFLRGAVVKYKTRRATVLIGGTCLKTLQRQHFPRSFNFRKAQHVTLETLKRRYPAIIDPGNWIRWILDNVPRHLAQAASHLQTFGTVLDPSDLEALVRFHDRKRLFPRRALLGTDVRVLEAALASKIATYITIEQARTILKRATPKLALLPTSIFAADYAKKAVIPKIQADDELKSVWEQLTPLERRGLVALAALDEKAAEKQGILCTDEVAAAWPPTGQLPLFVWNPHVGLGFVGVSDALDGCKAYVWLWRSETYKKSVFNLQYWRGIRGCSAAAVAEVEKLAFSGQTLELTATIL